MSDHQRKPPHSIEAEQAVIGSVLMTPSVWDDVAYLREEDFFLHAHRELWATMHRGEQFRDLVNLIVTCQNKEQQLYVGELARNTISAANAKFYAQTIRERSSLRKLMAVAIGIFGSINETTSAADAVSGAIRDIEAIGEAAVTGKGPRHIGEIGGEWYEIFRERTQSSGKLVGLPTGFDAIDERWGGMRGGQMIVIAGRPKRGKSTLAANIAQFVAMNNPVLIFNMEMSSIEVADRAVSYQGRIDIGKIRNGTLSEDDYTELPHVWQTVKGSRLYVDDTPSQTIDAIRLASKVFVKRHGQTLIVIDYLQLIRGKQDQGSYERVSEISRGIKLLAKETNCPVIAVVQMNRSIEGANRKPQLSDLRDSGAIEQDADIVSFVHQDEEDQEHCEFITRAIRSGEAGTDFLLRNFSRSRFEPAPFGYTPKPKEKPKGEQRKTRKPGFLAGE